MISNNQRSKLRAKLWRIFREVGGSDIEIERDPLHRRYEVNRHSMRVTGPKSVLDDVYDRALALLVIHGWRLVGGQFIGIVRYGDLEHDVKIERPFESPVTAYLPKGEREAEGYILIHI